MAAAPEHLAAINLESQCAHYEVNVRGVVQGVGFRPFVYRLAAENCLNGEVWNHSCGVTVHVQGALKDLNIFVRRLKQDLPAPARIDELLVTEHAPREYSSFTIRKSEKTGSSFAHIPPDLALCNDCRREFESHNDRRHAYPFINCTQCGPRFTIIKSVPYDRPATTMASFPLCEQCSEEYHTPTDRRFHAQPVACPECGPQLSFLRRKNGKWQAESQAADPVHDAAQILRNGGLLLVKGLGGYHLSCDACNEAAVRTLRLRKRRNDKPFAVLLSDMQLVERWCEVSPNESKSLRSPQAPIVLLQRRPECPVAPSVAPDTRMLGVMLPYSPLHLALMNSVQRPLVMTSANVSDDPIEYRDSLESTRLSTIADGVLMHNREIQIFADDSVVRVVKNRARVWRRSRGYVPRRVHVQPPFQVPVLGFGADLKNAFAIGKDDSAILSQYLGNLESDSCNDAARTALDHMLTLFDVHVEQTVCDLHPEYISTRLAEKWSRTHNIPLCRVQHHHAHLAACLAEHNEVEPALGIILDGTGYGTDGTIWGGELLYGNNSFFNRMGRLALVPMLGGDLAAREPWRMALAWLNAAFGADVYELDAVIIKDIKNKYGDHSLQLLLDHALINKCAETSSMGRLFDATAALIGFGVRHQYEGQAAMWLEGIMHREFQGLYSIGIEINNGMIEMNPRQMFRELLRDLRQGVSPQTMSRRFHDSIVEAWSEMTIQGVDLLKIDTVALTGGCFQNAFLLDELSTKLEHKGLRVLLPESVPCNDGAIALGQICIANAQE
ncbi:MAG: carbamoyltransferase HypF [Calditrichaeota bacterium]|nr:carbamoyltransferase HypF [Calditrichota bacterium]MCB9367324.1 carbamoyltransferase HypF [Calditrichota bacterium]